MKKQNKFIDGLINKEALIMVVKYGAIGLVWVATSDSILSIFAYNLEAYKIAQTYKGWLFVLITMITVYILVNNRDKRVKAATEDSIKAVKELRHMAYYDTLTGLPNRAAFEGKIRNLINKTKKEFSIAYLDIDNFKYINDTLGHFMGDNFLKFIALKISGEIKAPNMVARLGGDEFAILIQGFESKEKTLCTLDSITCNIGNTWNSGTRDFFISTSVGVAVYPYDGEDFDALLKNADIAMYAAKKEGKNKIVFYDNKLQEETLQQVKMSHKLQEGLDKKEFELYYQPQIELSTGKIIGVEALVRWKNGNEGYIQPDEFIPVAEITGQIYELDRRILENALIQKKIWEEQGLNELEISINLSSRSIINNSNFSRLEKIFDSYDIDYSNIIIEVTETAVISNIEIAIERLNALKSKGLRIALDDFGTGYSSITYLKKLPIDIIKLDKSYINSIHNDIKDFSIVKFLVLLAHDLGFCVVAEGIETDDQLDYLNSIKCEYGQGYLVGRPMSINEINKILDVNNYC